MQHAVRQKGLTWQQAPCLLCYDAIKLHHKSLRWDRCSLSDPYTFETKLRMMNAGKDSNCTVNWSKMCSVRAHDVSFEQWVTMHKGKWRTKTLYSMWGCQRKSYVWSLTFIGHLEAQGPTGVICFEIKPHLVTGANHKVWSGGTRQTTKRDKKTGFLNRNFF